jgi:hypothetical protein
LVTPPGQEAYEFLRENFAGYGLKTGKRGWETHADVDPEHEFSSPFYRNESRLLFERIGELRPGVLYILGDESNVNAVPRDYNPNFLEERLRKTGCATGGSGGVHEGRVAAIVFEGVSHLVPMEVPTRTAEAIAPWLVNEVKRWRNGEARLQETWFSKTLIEKQAISEEWKKQMGGPPNRGGKKSKM